MDFFLNPNVVYLVSVLTVLTILAAIVAPGTGIIEILALFLLGVSAYMMYSLGVNAWALVLLILSIVPFFIAIQKKKNYIPYLVASIIMLIAGSIFMFTTAVNGFLVNPVLAIGVSALAGIFIWFAARKSIQAQLATAHHDLGQLIDKIGEARTDVQEEGSVQVGSELWSARSAEPIPSGSAVRVTGREGFTLIVEKINE